MPSLVGSEMCIRDRAQTGERSRNQGHWRRHLRTVALLGPAFAASDLCRRACRPCACTATPYTEDGSGFLSNPVTRVTREPYEYRYWRQNKRPFCWNMHALNLSLRWVYFVILPQSRCRRFCVATQVLELHTRSFPPVDPFIKKYLQKDVECSNDA